uniref:Uncharacterized protein n=1 Tax=Oryza rufipogon TaxID=4529 RepID=A0A0E0Q9U5_ORYRU
MGPCNHEITAIITVLLQPAGDICTEVKNTVNGGGSQTEASALLLTSLVSGIGGFPTPAYVRGRRPSNGNEMVVGHGGRWRWGAKGKRGPFVKIHGHYQ